MGPIGGARVGVIDGEYVVNPTLDQMDESDLDLVVAGTTDAVLMVESEAKELSEDTMLGAVMAGHNSFQPVIEAIIRLAERAAREPRELETVDTSEIDGKVRGLVEGDLVAAYGIPTKEERYEAIAAAKDKAVEALCDEEDENAYTPQQLSAAPSSPSSRTSFAAASSKPARVSMAAVSPTFRQIKCEVGVLPRTHGSALFTRGETQALVVTTLGTGDDEQFIDALEGTYKENFLLHYNFPPFSVGETGRVGFTGRREIGHGKLAWRAMHPMMPGNDQFPYTIRVVSEITESNGSSSMATVCGSSLALMDAGVPLRRPVAGIAMGLILEGEKFAVLSDILGDEDHLGDMDFKVAGTDEGITSLQMDIKITGITEEIMRTALFQAKDGRMHILNCMSEALTEARPALGEYAPRIESMNHPGRQDPRSHRLRRQGHPRDRRKDRCQGRYLR